MTFAGIALRESHEGQRGTPDYSSQDGCEEGEKWKLRILTATALTALVLPMLWWVGEACEDGTVDPPVPFDFKASSLRLTVDGRVVADSTRSKLDCLDFKKIYFAEPIPTVPTDYGSNASIHASGLGILLPPMSPGEHIIEMQGVMPTFDLWGRRSGGSARP